MVLCRSCGFGNVEGMRFCGDCGARLDTAAARTRRERKVVTVLFCDLVGFTAASDGADPEEVQAALSPNHATARVAIERSGGTMEKFIADAVMVAFGAPVVHEDDPEQAVRAGLGLLTGARADKGRALLLGDGPAGERATGGCTSPAVGAEGRSAARGG